MTLLTRKRALLATGLVAVVAAAGGYAFFSGGSGSGTATVGTASAISITSTTNRDLFPETAHGSPPAGAPGNTTFVLTNSGKHAVVVHQIYLDTAAGTNGFRIDREHAEAGCDPADFFFVGLPLAVNESVAPDAPLTVAGSSDGHGGGAVDMVFSDSGRDQDVCQGATVTAYYRTN